MTAIYKVALRRARGKSQYVAKEYLEACKEEWKQSTKIWMIFLLTGCRLLFDILYAENLWKILSIAIGCIAKHNFKYTEKCTLPGVSEFTIYNRNRSVKQHSGIMCSIRCIHDNDGYAILLINWICLNCKNKQYFLSKIFQPLMGKEVN